MKTKLCFNLTIIFLIMLIGISIGTMVNASSEGLVLNKYEIITKDGVNYIIGIYQSTRVSEIKENIKQSVEIYDKTGKKMIDANIVHTGAYIQDKENNYTIIVCGDINGDGKISLTDLAKLKNEILKKGILKEENKVAADINLDKKITLTDMVYLKKLIVRNISEVDIYGEEIGITLNEEMIELQEGQTLALVGIVISSNMENETIIWASSDTSVATVNADGVVTAKKAGTAVITATTNNGKITKCTITVKNIEASSIVLNEIAVELQKGQTLTLVGTIVPNNAKDKAIAWASSDTSVVTVSNDGVVTAKGEGTAVVTATTNNGKTAKCTIIVKNVEATSITLNEETVKLQEGQTLTLVGTIAPSNVENETITWISNNTSVATVSNTGAVTTKSEGTAVITATTNNGKTAKCTITVKNIEAAIITLDKTTLELTEGKSYTLMGTILPSNAKNKTITWKSSNTSVAIVSSSGVVTAKSAGTAIVTATTSNGKTVKCTVTVKNIEVASIKLNKTTVELTVGKKYTLIGTIAPSDAKNKTITWTSSNTSVAIVSSTGVVTAKKAGTVVITATTNNGKTAKCTINVTNSYKIHFMKTPNKTGEVVNGDAILIESNGHYGLIDAGYSWNFDMISSYLRSVGVEKLDFYLITHLHKDHIGAYNKIIPQYKPTTLYIKHYSGNEASGGVWDATQTNTYINLQDRIVLAARGSGTEVVFVDNFKDGKKTISLGGTKIVLYNLINRLAPGSAYYRKTSENVNSIIQYVEINGVKAMLYADLDITNVAEYYAKLIGKIDILKLPHHAYNGQTNTAISNYHKPSYAIATNSNLDVLNVTGVIKYTTGNKVYFTGSYSVIIADCTSGTVKIQTKK